ncbi:sulfate transporter family-domain-containing protein [Kockiozyma suomiensis]|uniref:sulfate transporter family-domain-containing protein n=1 Tax=Kockiozyma suomiensis TaxID=1337062 RepID=UPI003343C411
MTADADDEASSRLLPDSGSTHSVASSFLRSRLFSFGSSTGVSSAVAETSAYTALDRALDHASRPDDTILGAPRRPGSPAHLKARHPHRAEYGALSSAQSLSSCATEVNHPKDEPEADPRLFSHRRRDRFRAKSTYYLKYYLPILTWLPNYSVKAALAGDILAGLTIASFNIPLSLAYARTQIGVPEKYGLLGFTFPQIIYACMGTVPVMVTGPEPAISVMIGQAIAPFVTAGNPSFEEMERRAIMYNGIITALFAIIYLVMGFLRLGFVDALLSQGLLRGFITAVGIVLTFDTLIQALGLSAIAAAQNIPTASAGVKLGFILTNLKNAHGLTAAISFIGFFLIIFFRVSRKRWGKRFPALIYFPDIFLIVVFSIIMSWKLDWYSKGADIVGGLERPNIELKSPLTSETLPRVSEIASSAFIIALLGFFQTAAIAKNIFADPPTNPHVAPPKNPTISMNRELVALGTANLLGMFMFSLPVIGGYGRSKANAVAGARTQLCSIVFAFATIIVTFALLPAIYYLPRATLAAVLGLICIGLLEDFPSELIGYFKMHAWGDLTLVTIMIAITLGVSLQIGISVGIVISLVQIMRHATRTRIQVLARVPGTIDTFRNADVPSHDVADHELDSLEKLHNVLLVKITEPLTFANCGELQSRLRRLERYGTMRMHPSLPAMRSGDQNVVFDLEGMTACDTTAIKVLLAIVEAYRSKGKFVLFARLPATKKMMLLFKRSGLSRLLSYNSHPPAYFSSIHGALEALDECIFETPGNWSPEDEDREIEAMADEDPEAIEEDSIATDIEGSSEGEETVDEKTYLKREMV